MVVNLTHLFCRFYSFVHRGAVSNFGCQSPIVLIQRSLRIFSTLNTILTGHHIPLSSQAAQLFILELFGSTIITWAHDCCNPIGVLVIAVKSATGYGCRMSGWWGTKGARCGSCWTGRGTSRLFLALELVTLSIVDRPNHLIPRIIAFDSLKLTRSTTWIR